MEYSNFFMLQKFSLKYKYFCFFDTKNYLADRLFIKHKVRVWFMQEYEKQGTKFLIIFCKIRKKDENEFIKALDELKSKMLLLGYANYPRFCAETMASIQVNGM